MARSAKVTSIDVLPLLAAALQKFRSEGAGAADDVDNEVRRALEWIHHDRKDYWTQELRRAEEALNQARIALQQATTMRRVADRDPACIDEKRALERAKRRVETARRKIEAVRHWSIALERAADDFRRCHSQFASWIDIDVLRGVAALNKMSESLVTYISMKVSDEPPPETPDVPETPAGGADISVCREEGAGSGRQECLPHPDDSKEGES